MIQILKRLFFGREQTDERRRALVMFGLSYTECVVYETQCGLVAKCLGEYFILQPDGKTSDGRHWYPISGFTPEELDTKTE